MYDNLKKRRLNLLWQGVLLAGQEGHAELGGAAARAASYREAFGERQYMEVLEFDVEQLLKDRAVEVAYEHRMYGAGDFTLYRLTSEGRRMLFHEGFPIDPQR